MDALAPRASPAADLGPAGIRTFLRIAARWSLSPEEQQTLLGVPRATYYKWRRQPPARLSRDVLERISYIFGIYKALAILIPDPGARDGWVRRPNTNPLFAGEPPLTRMLAGNVADLYLVRRYLDGERGG